MRPEDRDLLENMLNPPQRDPRFKADDGLKSLQGGQFLSYEKAIEHTKFEHCRFWCWGTLCPRYVNGHPADFKTAIWSDFQEFRASIAHPDKPGTAITLATLLSAALYYRGYYNENPYLRLYYSEVVAAVEELIAEGKE